MKIKEMKNKYLVFIGCSLILLIACIFVSFSEPSYDITYGEFITMIEGDEIKEVALRGDLIKAATYNESEVLFVKNTSEEVTVKYLLDHNVELTKETDVQSIMVSLLMFVSGLGIVMTGTYFMIASNRKKEAREGIIDIECDENLNRGDNIEASEKKSKKENTKKKHKKGSGDKSINTDVTFADVAGQEEAKESFREIIDYLHNPKRYIEIGAKLPKGVLLVGAPGTGKTLLARAVSGEAKVPFYSLSGSDFVEMFAGVGAKRVRELFEDAKENAPCIIFIDEIDGVGKRRADGDNGPGGDEREQTLNQLLTEMDGFDSDNAIVVLAATNRPEVLDVALRRPGRFDRQIEIGKPDMKGRLETLKVHTKKVKIADNINLEEIAMMTSGAVGADLANIVNEAALLAIKKKNKVVSKAEFVESIEVVFAGREKKDRILTAKEKEMVAYHEVGHAVIARIVNGANSVKKVTIVPRTMGSLGYTMQAPTEEKFLVTSDEILNEARVLIAGRCSEEIFLGKTSSGAASDITRLTKLIRDAVAVYGMSEKLGMTSFAVGGDSNFLGNDLRENCSESTSIKIDEEVIRIIKILYDDVYAVLRKSESVVKGIVDELIISESIDGAVVNKHFNTMNRREAALLKFSDEGIFSDTAKESGIKPVEKNGPTPSKASTKPATGKKEINKNNEKDNKDNNNANDRREPNVSTAGKKNTGSVNTKARDIEVAQSKDKKQTEVKKADKTTAESKGKKKNNVLDGSAQNKGPETKPNNSAKKTINNNKDKNIKPDGRGTTSADIEGLLSNTKNERLEEEKKKNEEIDIDTSVVIESGNCKIENDEDNINVVNVDDYPMDDIGAGMDLDVGMMDEECIPDEPATFAPPDEPATLAPPDDFSEEAICSPDENGEETVKNDIDDIEDIY